MRSAPVLESTMDATSETVLSETSQVLPRGGRASPLASHLDGLTLFLPSRRLSLPPYRTETACNGRDGEPLGIIGSSGWPVSCNAPQRHSSQHPTRLACLEQV